MVTKEISAGEYAWVYQYDPERSARNLRLYLALKRMTDIVMVAATMPLWLPIVMFIAMLIWLQAPGAPIFFAQKRTGKGGKRFMMYKFRTMVPNAEELKQKYMHLNELHWPDFKISHDPRVTRMGHFLRRSSLDELPQLFNVLIGDMSLVGPRPTSFGAETYRLWQTERLDVQPGLTGLWQVVGRGRTEFDERLRMDIAYMERRCLALDAMILFRTLGSAFVRRKGAR